MITLRKATDRFHTKIDWLDSWHTFSFGEHYDANHMAFGPLRVINEDRIKGGAGFPTHGHKDMEIITLVLSGSLSHKDSIGNGSAITPGDVQKMSAGKGILHSEFNASATEACHLLQIWIIPSVTGIKPEYQQIHFEPEQWRNQLCLVASPEAKDGTILLHQDARMYVAQLSKGASVEYAIGKNRGVWAHLATGKADINGMTLIEGDALALEDEKSFTCNASEDSTLLVFDVEQSS